MPVFSSHSHQDKDFVDVLAAPLDAVLKSVKEPCWADSRA